MNTLARRLISPLLLAAAFSFALGVTLPIVRFEKLYFLTDTPSLVSLLLSLWDDGSLLLAIVVFVFSFVFPLVKLAIVFHAAFGRADGDRGRALPGWTSVLAKWSMMDVLLVALVVFAAKSSGLATAMAQPGLWFYAGSAIAGAVAAGLLKRVSADAGEPVQARKVAEGT